MQADMALPTAALRTPEDIPQYLRMFSGQMPWNYSISAVESRRFLEVT